MPDTQFASKRLNSVKSSGTTDSSSTSFLKKKVSPKVILGLLLLLLVVIGLGSALILMNINQDVRQQAREEEYASEQDRIASQGDTGSDQDVSTNFCLLNPTSSVCVSEPDAREISACEAGGGSMVGNVCVGNTSNTETFCQINPQADLCRVDYQEVRETYSSVGYCMQNNPGNTSVCETAFALVDREPSQSEIDACGSGGGTLVDGLCVGGNSHIDTYCQINPQADLCNPDTTDQREIDACSASGGELQGGVCVATQEYLSESGACQAAGGSLDNGVCHVPNDNGEPAYNECQNAGGTHAQCVRVITGHPLLTGPQVVEINKVDTDFIAWLRDNDYQITREDEPRKYCYSGYCAVAVGASNQDGQLREGQGSQTIAMQSNVVLGSSGQFEEGVFDIINDLTTINNNPDALCSSQVCNVAGFEVPIGTLVNENFNIDVAEELIYLQLLENKGYVNNVTELVNLNPELLNDFEVNENGAVTVANARFTASAWGDIIIAAATDPTFLVGIDPDLAAQAATKNVGESCSATSQCIDGACSAGTCIALTPAGDISTCAAQTGDRDACRQVIVANPNMFLDDVIKCVQQPFSADCQGLVDTSDSNVSRFNACVQAGGNPSDCRHAANNNPNVSGTDLARCIEQPLTADCQGVTITTSAQRACEAGGGTMSHTSRVCEGTVNPSDLKVDCGGDGQRQCLNQTVNRGCDSGMIPVNGGCAYNPPNLLVPESVCYSGICAVAIGPSDPNTGIMDERYIGATQSLPAHFVLRSDGEFEENMVQIIEDLTQINNEGPESRCYSSWCSVGGYSIPSRSLLAQFGDDGRFLIDTAQELVFLQNLDNQGLINLEELLRKDPYILEKFDVNQNGKVTFPDGTSQTTICDVNPESTQCTGGSGGLKGSGFTDSFDCSPNLGLCCRDGCCQIPDGYFGVTFSQNNIDFAPGVVSSNYTIHTGDACITGSPQVTGECGEIQLDVFKGDASNFSLDGLGAWLGEGYARSGLFTSYVGNGACVGTTVTTGEVTVTTTGQGGPGDGGPGGGGGGTPPVEPPDNQYFCGSGCTSDSQCQTADSRFFCSSDYGNTCRLQSNPDSAQCQPAVGPQCLSLTMSNVTDPGAAATEDPEIGDALRFTCGEVQGADHYIFRVIEPGGTIVNLNATGRTSESYTVDKNGGFAVQCQICTGAADSTCLPYEDPYNQPVP